MKCFWLPEALDMFSAWRCMQKGGPALGPTLKRAKRGGADPWTSWVRTCIVYNSIYDIYCTCRINMHVGITCQRQSPLSINQGIMVKSVWRPTTRDLWKAHFSIWATTKSTAASTGTAKNVCHVIHDFWYPLFSNLQYLIHKNKKRTSLISVEPSRCGWPHNVRTRGRLLYDLVFISPHGKTWRNINKDLRTFVYFIMQTWLHDCPPLFGGSLDSWWSVI